MKLLDLLFLFLLSNVNVIYAQWPNDTKRFNRNYARAIDDQETLMSGNVLTFSHSTDYECVHLTDTYGIIHLIDIRGRTAPGYFILFEDRPSKVIFEVRGSGSGNPPFYLAVSKFNCEFTWLPDGKPE